MTGKTESEACRWAEYKYTCSEACTCMSISRNLPRKKSYQLINYQMNHIFAYLEKAPNPTLHQMYTLYGFSCKILIIVKFSPDKKTKYALFEYSK